MPSLNVLCSIEHSEHDTKSSTFPESMESSFMKKTTIICSYETGVIRKSADLNCFFSWWTNTCFGHNTVEPSTAKEIKKNISYKNNREKVWISIKIWKTVNASSKPVEPEHEVGSDSHLQPDGKTHQWKAFAAGQHLPTGEVRLGCQKEANWIQKSQDLCSHIWFTCQWIHQEHKLKPLPGISGCWCCKSALYHSCQKVKLHCQHPQLPAPQTDFTSWQCVDKNKENWFFFPLNLYLVKLPA